MVMVVVMMMMMMIMMMMMMMMMMTTTTVVSQTMGPSEDVLALSGCFCYAAQLAEPKGSNNSQSWRREIAT